MNKQILESFKKYAKIPLTPERARELHERRKKYAADHYNKVKEGTVDTSTNRGKVKPKPKRVNPKLQEGFGVKWVPKGWEGFEKSEDNYMPKKVHDCAKKLQEEGKSEESSWAICNASVNDEVNKAWESWNKSEKEREKKGEIKIKQAGPDYKPPDSYFQSSPVPFKQNVPKRVKIKEKMKLKEVNKMSEQELEKSMKAMKKAWNDYKNSPIAGASHEEVDNMDAKEYGRNMSQTDAEKAKTSIMNSREAKRNPKGRK